MPRKAELLYSLSRGRVRASWNKYNLFNLYKKGRINFQGQNLYQQKWTSKQETRAYHGEFLTENRLQSTFSSKLESVANLDAYLRGGDDGYNAPTPIPLQTYADLEKRLDFALFRSLFASSIRQARQFILHGYVSVNGIRIRQPGFTLQPGDVFNILPEKALLALGATKPSLKQSIKVDGVQIAKWNQYVKRAKANPLKVWEEKRGTKTEVVDEAKVKQYNNEVEAKMLKEQKQFTKPKVLKDIISLGLKDEEPTFVTFENTFSKQVSEKALKLYTKLTELYKIEDLKTKPDDLIKDILAKDVQRSDSDKKQISDIKQLIASVQSIHWEILRKESDSKKLNKDATEIPYDPKWAESLQYHSSLVPEAKEKEHLAKVNLPWQKGLFGRQEPKKSYFTPWKVRPFIAPFAILPSHIEISFETCHAVYLRDPVASPGKSEVITPFNLSVHERAYMWYIRRIKTSKR